MLHDVTCRVGCRFRPIGGDEVDHFSCPVRDGQDGVVGSHVRRPWGQAQYPIDMDRLPFPFWYQERLDFPSGGFHSLAGVASSYVVVHKFLHVVEDISAMEYLESLATTPVSGRDGVVASGDDFLAFGLGNRDAFIQRHFPW